MPYKLGTDHGEGLFLDEHSATALSWNEPCLLKHTGVVIQWNSRRQISKNKNCRLKTDSAVTLKQLSAQSVMVSARSVAQKLRNLRELAHDVLCRRKTGSNRRKGAAF